MKKIALLFLGLLAIGKAGAQVSITSSSLTYTQNFDNLDTANANSSNLPAGWSIFEYGTSTTTVNNQYKGSDGNSNTGDTYSYGTSGTTERALGSISSGSLNSHYGVKFTNNTGSTITGFTITYKGEEWRFGQTGRTNLDSLRFLYSTSATAVSDTAASLYTENFGLLFTTPNMTATTGPLNGNAAGNFAVISGTVTTAIPTGGSLVLKWVDKNIGGTDDALALDSLTVTFTIGVTSPRPSIVGLSPNNGSTNVATTSNLLITFNKAVQKGTTGNFYIRNETDQTTLTKAATSTDVVASGGNLVIITNVGLVLGKTYHVTFDSAAIDSGGHKSFGIYDTTYWRFSTPPVSIYRPVITALNPTDNATSVAPGTSSLNITFNRAVTKGTGNITIFNTTDVTNQPIAVTSSDVVVSGNLVTINNVTLLAGKSYAVRFDSSAFDTSGYKSYGIYNDTAWNFTTQGPVQTVTTLNEQFDNTCANSNTVPPGWLQYSITGAQTWRCSGATTAPNYYMTMNGGSGSPVVFTANEDWLITPKLNLSAMTTPQLLFRNRFRFAGDNMHVMLSTNYSGTGDPSTAVWQDLNVTYDVVADSNRWVTKSVNLTGFKSNPFFIAFKYTSTTSSARQWDVDSVLTIDAPTGIHNISKGNSLPVSVLGLATNSHVAIGFDLPKAAVLEAAIYDMAGREVHRSAVRGEKGANRVVLQPQGLQSGMYIIRLSNGEQQGIARTFIQ